MTIVKCCFLIDATASMGLWIEAAKTQARTIMRDLMEEHPTQRFFFAAVFYRDFEDATPFIEIPFQDDITFDIQDVRPIGGGDIPEDVAGGYERVLSMDWSNADVKFCFHIADAPPHGREWHTPDIEDAYPSDVLSRRPLEDTIRDLHDNEIRLTIFRVNESLNIMIDRFVSIYGNELHVEELPHDYSPMIGGDVARMLSRGITRQITETLSLID